MSTHQSIAALRRHALLELGEDSDEPLKTGTMLRLERKHKQSIRELLTPRSGISGAELAKRLGVSEAVISRWRKRLGIKAPAARRPRRRGAS